MNNVALLKEIKALSNQGWLKWENRWNTQLVSDKNSFVYLCNVLYLHIAILFTNSKTSIIKSYRQPSIKNR